MGLSRGFVHRAQIEKAIARLLALKSLPFAAVASVFLLQRSRHGVSLNEVPLRQIGAGMARKKEMPMPHGIVSRRRRLFPAVLIAVA
ncbi:unnamed protein product [Ciceribacter selenitireducens ATCC BAA-1503]|uniref:Uncharacterized protein n=1 Tax=Ciceribacter selenitireducens ATCC BAA-1503 TaxID=1336235 RepID=A0A376AIP3_9HYPH|nr:unnamed protein product [Ciceribacter selenitireducens ATCC BAA-1503]